MPQNGSETIESIVNKYKIFGYKSKKLIFNSFIMSNFNFCPLVDNKLEQIHERSLRILLSDTNSDYKFVLDTFVHIY